MYGDFRIDDNLFAIRQASRWLTRIYKHHLQPTDLSPTQFILLDTFAQSTSIRRNDLEVSLAMDRTTLTRAIAPLLKRRLINRLGTTAQGWMSYALTSDGRGILEEAYPRWEAAQAEVAARYGEQRTADLRHEIRALRKTGRDL
jgi:DNA-binding MarR family transcriptional regulator